MVVSIGICCYNEAQNVGLLLGWLTKNRPNDEIIVVASGCNDGTVEICHQFEPRIRLLVQEKREGKASAINLFLKEAHGDILILESADTIPGILCIERLVSAIVDNVGIAGAHVIPSDDKTNIANKIGSIIWEICHNLSMHNPKLGEMICFKNVVKHIDGGTSVDEALIQGEIIKMGYQAVYVQDAIVWNKTCDNLQDLICQRKRIYKGHLQLKQKGYAVSSMNLFDVAFATLAAWQSGIIRAIGLEIYARVKATQEFKRSKTEETVWERCQTTKALTKR